VVELDSHLERQAFRDSEWKPCIEVLESSQMAFAQATGRVAKRLCSVWDDLRHSPHQEEDVISTHRRRGGEAIFEISIKSVIAKKSPFAEL
jgi:hypothetical protein